MKSKLTSEIELIENGDKSLNEFKTELDLLYQERVNLLDELRNVDSDIATLEKTIKQSEEEKRRAMESAKRLKLDYRPLKEQIGHLIESIGLSSTDDAEDDTLIENFLSKLGSDDTPNTTPPKYSLGIDRLLNDKPKLESNNNNISKHSNEEQVSAFTSAIKSNNALMNHPFFLSQMDLPVQLATAALMAHSLRHNRPPSPSQIQHVPLPQSVQFNPFQSHQSHQQQQQQQQFNHFILNQMNSNSSTSITSEAAQSESQIQLQPPQFRQQPPPMKACLSCNQQIHRNAPICPLCKAKSRSRNPKKPKKSTKSNSPDSLSPDHKQASVKRSLTDA